MNSALKLFTGNYKDVRRRRGSIDWHLLGLLPALTLTLTFKGPAFIVPALSAFLSLAHSLDSDVMLMMSHCLCNIVGVKKVHRDFIMRTLIRSNCSCYVVGVTVVAWDWHNATLWYKALSRCSPDGHVTLKCHVTPWRWMKTWCHRRPINDMHLEHFWDIYSFQPNISRQLAFVWFG